MGAPILDGPRIPVAAEGRVIDQPLRGRRRRVPRSPASRWATRTASSSCPRSRVSSSTALGPRFEHHPFFPERVNTEFVAVRSRREVDLRVWERGSGETMACGTGACAAVVAGGRSRTHRPARDRPPARRRSRDRVARRRPRDHDRRRRRGVHRRRRSRHALRRDGGTMSARTPRFSGSMVALVTPFRDGAVDWQAFGAIDRAPDRRRLDRARALRLDRRGGDADARRAHRGRALRGRACARTRAGDRRHRLQLHRRSDPAHDRGEACRRRPRRCSSRPTTTGPRRKASRPLPGDRRRRRAAAHPLQHPRPHGLAHRGGDHRRVSPSIPTSSASRSRTPPTTRSTSCSSPATTSRSTPATTRRRSPILALGGAGVISTIANAVPRPMADLAAAGRAGEWERARELQFRLLPFIRACFAETNPIGLKHALALLGLCRDELRLPLVPLADSAKRAALASRSALSASCARTPVATAGTNAPLPIVVCGAAGRMGQMLVRLVAAEPHDPAGRGRRGARPSGARARRRRGRGRRDR